MGTVNPQFRGLEVRLCSHAGSWWLEITPVPTTSQERLRRPWRSVFRVPFLAIEGPLTYEAFLQRLGQLAVEAHMKDTFELVPYTSR